jgi:hypothetical protein
MKVEARRNGGEEVGFLVTLLITFQFANQFALSYPQMSRL